MKDPISEHGASSFRAFGSTSPLFVLLLAFAYQAVAVESDYSFYWRDPAAIVNTSPWIGLFSSIGVFIWWMAAVISVFTAMIVWRVPDQRRRATYLLTSGLLTGMFALDDFFMVHEWIVPTYLPLSNEFMFGVYIVVGAVLLIAFRDEILETPYRILALAGLILGMSIAIDVLVFDILQQRGLYPRLTLNLEYIVEDGLKLVGVIAWLHYFALTCFETIQQSAFGKQPAQPGSRDESADSI